MSMYIMCGYEDRAKSLLAALEPIVEVRLEGKITVEVVGPVEDEETANRILEALTAHSQGSVAQLAEASDSSPDQ